MTAGGPAAKAGLQVGDVVTHLNGDVTVDPSGLFVQTVGMRAGDKVSIQYERDGKEHSTTLTLAAQPTA